MSTTLPRRPSKAAVKAHRAALLAQRAQGEGPLPEEYLVWLDTYIPQNMSAPEWAVLRPFVREVLQRSKKRGVVDLKKRTWDLACFAAWLQSRAVPLDPQVAMTRRYADEYTRVGMPATIEKSRSDRRSRLHTLADQVNPDAAPLHPVPIGRKATRAPYTDGEVAAILRVIKIQPTRLLVRQLAVCVGLGLGAGIDSADLKLLYPRHVHLSEQGIRVEVPGPRARTVWVRRDLEAVVRRGLADTDTDLPLIGRNPGRSNVAAKIFDAATWVGDLPKLDQSRLRTTWLAWLMNRPVSLSTICTAAGLISTRALFDLLPHLDAQTTAADLRDGGVR